jgi:hypothetical protein
MSMVKEKMQVLFQQEDGTYKDTLIAYWLPCFKCGGIIRTYKDGKPKGKHICRRKRK